MNRSPLPAENDLDPAYRGAHVEPLNSFELFAVSLAPHVLTEAELETVRAGVPDDDGFDRARFEVQR